MPLTVSIAQGGTQADPIGSLPIVFTVTFSQAIAPLSFTTADITQSGTATGVTWSLSTSNNITFTLSATAVAGEGTLVPSIAAGAVQDTVGTSNSASTSTDGSVTYQIIPGTFSITGITGGSDVTANASLASGLVPTVNWNASANASSYDVRIYANDGTTVVCPTVNTTSTSYNFSSCTLSYSSTYKASVIAKRASGTTTNASNNLYSFTTVAPLTVAVAQGGSQADPAASLPVNFTVTFSRAIDPASFTTADITQSGTATGVTWSRTTIDNTNYTLSATAVTGEGTLVPSIAAGAVQDPSGNPNAASTSVDSSVTYQAPPGAFTISGVTGGSDSTADSSLASGLVPTINWVAATNANSYDVSVYANDGTTVVCATANTTSTSYNFSSCTLSSGITYKASVIAKRTSGGTTTATNSLYSFTTAAALTVVVAQGGSQVDPASTLPVVFTVTFSRAISAASFTTADITESGTATGVTWSLTTSNNITYTLSATAVTGEGTLVPSIAAGAVQDASSNPNSASTAVDGSVTYQAPPGAFAISGVTGGTDSTADSSLASGLVPTINWGASTNANSYDVRVYANNGTTVVCATANTTSTSYNFSSCTLSSGTTYKASVTAKRTSGGTTTATNNLYSFTTVAALTVAVSQGGSQADPATSLPIAFTVTFSRAISAASFTTADITQTGTATGITWSLSTSNNITYTLSATAVTGAGTLVPTIGAGAVQDASANPNTASTAVDGSVTYQTGSGLTIADVVAAQTATSHEGVIPDIRYEWQRYPMIIMQSPAKADIPSWFPYTKPNWCTLLNAWMQVFEAEGNTATNTRVEYRSLKIYVLSQSTRTWSLLKNDLKPVYTDTWKYPFDFDSDGGDRAEPSGGVSFKAKYPLFAHGYGGQLIIVPSDVRAVFVTMDTRLILDNASGTDDRASARYLVNVGADYWPDADAINNTWPYAPGAGQGRFILATPEWRKATMIIPNGRYGSSMQEMLNTYPPPMD
ncbi:beta strand repeat-containing protein [Bdellovibrio sp. HCB274]|uniref:beta strand repeat-containing protein n=1 Tax=Bdellovibrio sp. HCB274 TaxID=3394361 RepID=UPI0039B5665C